MVRLSNEAIIFKLVQLLLVRVDKRIDTTPKFASKLHTFIFEMWDLKPLVTMKPTPQNRFTIGSCILGLILELDTPPVLRGTRLQYLYL